MSGTSDPTFDDLGTSTYGRYIRFDFSQPMCYGSPVDGCTHSHGQVTLSEIAMYKGETDVVDCNGNCGGNAQIDECGVCDGSGIADGACDCDGNILDCAGECGGSTIEDDCGVCGGDIYLEDTCTDLACSMFPVEAFKAPQESLPTPTLDVPVVFLAPQRSPT